MVFPNANLKNIYGMTETGAIAKSDTLGKSLPLAEFNLLTYTTVFGYVWAYRSPFFRRVPSLRRFCKGKISPRFFPPTVIFTPEPASRNLEW
jgi:hypothetical protein